MTVCCSCVGYIVDSVDSCLLGRFHSIEKVDSHFGRVIDWAHFYLPQSTMTAAPRVFVRLRPPSEYEAEKRRRRVVEVVDRSTVAVVDDGQEFTCHGVSST